MHWNGIQVSHHNWDTVIWGNFGSTQKKKVLTFYISRLVEYFENIAVPLCGQHC
jgi:hypothetical protein